MVSRPRAEHTHLELPAPTLGTRNFSSPHPAYIVHTVLLLCLSKSGQFILNPFLFSTMDPHITGFPPQSTVDALANRAGPSRTLLLPRASSAVVVF